MWRCGSRCASLVVVVIDRAPLVVVIIVVPAAIIAALRRIRAIVIGVAPARVLRQFAALRNVEQLIHHTTSMQHNHTATIQQHHHIQRIKYCK
jgi:hypothetical protein